LGQFEQITALGCCPNNIYGSVFGRQLRRSHYVPAERLGIMVTVHFFRAFAVRSIRRRVKLEKIARGYPRDQPSVKQLAGKLHAAALKRPEQPNLALFLLILVNIAFSISGHIKK